MLTRSVSQNEWDLQKLQDTDRRKRLLNPPTPEALLATVIAEAHQNARAGAACIEWEPSCEKDGYFRVWAQFPICEITFDQLFNGRSGYRAQYYLSPEEGVLFNRRIVEGVMPALRAAYDLQPVDVPFSAIERCVYAPHCKIWVYREQEAFDAAERNMLNPARWVESCADRGRRIPLPSHHTVDFKGAFIHNESGELFVDPLKEDRACDLYRKGYS